MPRSILIPILPLTHFDFSYLPANEDESVAIARAIDVSWARSAILFVRVHANGLASGAKAGFGCYPTAPSEVDQQEFSGDPDLLLALTSAAVAPKYLRVTTSTINGPYWKIGSRIGLPPNSRTSMAGRWESCAASAATVMRSPGPSTASCP